MDDTPLLIWDWDMGVPYPIAVDDEFLTRAGAFPQPEHTSTLAGFHHVSRIFHLLGVVLSASRARRNTAASPEIADLLSLPRYAPSAAYTAALDGILATLPPELELRADAPGDEPAFAICRVNILITQAMVRQAIMAYAGALGEDTAGHAPRTLVMEMLRAMPTASLTANGDSLRMKVLYFVLQGMGSDDASSAEFLDMVSRPLTQLRQYMRLRETQDAHVLHEAPDISDGDGDSGESPAEAGLAR
jgi:hypothetical protein